MAEIELKRRTETERLRFVLERIRDMPFSMVNDSESLRHTLRTIQGMAILALADGR
jgi:hypothetical protein